MATGVGSGEIYMTPSDSGGRKIGGWMQTESNYLSGGRVVVNFVLKFVAMATGAGRRKI